ncbi:MAG: glycosyltransferase family 4 protein [Bdellovibrionales bacterium]
MSTETYAANICIYLEMNPDFSRHIAFSDDSFGLLPYQNRMESKTLKKKKVAHVCLSKGYGGLEIYSLLIHQMFKAAGYPSTHFCLDESGLKKHLEQESLDFHSFAKAKYFNPSVSLKIRKAVLEENIGSIYVHHLRDLWVVVPAIYGLKDVKLVGFAQMFLKDVNKKDYLHSLLYGRLRYLISLTDIQKEALKNCLPIPDEKYVTIPNSVNMDNYSPEKRDRGLRKSLEVGDNERLIGVVGRLDPLKGQLELVEAFSQLSSEFPDIKLLLVGDETPHQPGYKRELESLISKLNLGNRILLKGFQSDVNRWMASMDVFVMPSYEETFGIVLIEAMASQVPVVSTRAGGVPEILNNGDLGGLAEPKSADSLVMELRKILTHWERSVETARKARVVALDRYDLNNVFKKVESLIQ